MKQIRFFGFAMALLAVVIISCKKEKSDATGEAPVVNPASKFTVTADGNTYEMKIDAQSVVISDTAHLSLSGTSPEYSVRLVFKSVNHESGVGDYFLYCCRNDVFDRTTGTQKHWETDRAGIGMQKGYVKITRMDKSGYEGTYSMTAKVGTSPTAVRKEFTGSFHIIY